MNKRLIIIIMLLLIIIAVTACQTTKQEDTQGNIVQEEIQVKEETPLQEELLPEEQQITKDIPDQTSFTFNDDSSGKIEREVSVKYISPFTGLPVKDKVREKVVAVIIENAPQARPQAGLMAADIVYEFLVEGGITRFLALYWNNMPEKIGPVRSARPYMVETALDYNALLLHAGASPQGFAMLSDSGIKHLDQIFQGKYYWRSNERKAPHNLYTGDDRITPYLNKLTGQDYKQRFSFNQISFLQADDNRANNIIINYWGGNRIKYIYNESENLYYRYINKDFDYPHLAENGKQLNTRNLIVQFINTRVIDDEGRLEMKLEGEGDILFFKDGVITKGIWKKGSNSWTIFHDKTGKEIKLNPGQTWIEVVPTSVKVDY